MGDRRTGLRSPPSIGRHVNLVSRILLVTQGVSEKVGGGGRVAGGNSGCRGTFCKEITGKE